MTQPHNNQDEFLTSKEAMALLKCKTTTLWRHVKEGRIKKYAITRKSIYYSKQEILKLISTANNTIQIITPPLH